MKNTLFITEGEKSEPLFLEKMWKCYRGDEVEIYSYRTNIHVLIRDLLKYGCIDENIDLLGHLISRENNPEERIKLERKFTDIFLVFDMDIQDERANIEMMNAMIGTFNDSTDNGKLYLNYPMLESYKHLMSLDDENFKDRCVAVSDCCRYKETVGRECHRSLRNVGDYNLEIFDAIIRMHLRKANYILGDDFVLPPMDKLESLSGGDIMDAQVEKMLKDGSIFVLNTSMFNVVEYRPSDFLNTS